VSDQDLTDLPYRKPADESEEMRYLHARRKQLGGYLPTRKASAPPLTVPSLEIFRSVLDGSADREISTTMAFVRILTTLLKDKEIGKHIVPIVPDEARTFGMEGLFRQIGIYSAVGQLYTPVDAEQLMSYREDKKGQMLEEGINEAGSTCSWIAAATSYANHGISMVPFYVYYSMFGFQRVGDFIWAAGDMRARGFLIGATAGRTTLAGEGLQHQDGHSQLVATTIPNCRAYDPTFAYELVVIIQDGMQRMYVQNEGVFYYISVMNENYPQPALPAGAAQGIVKGGYLLQSGGKGKIRATLLGSGTILRECIAAAALLEQQFAIPADVFSITSFSELRRDALECERWNLLHPADAPRTPYVRSLLGDREGPLVAATDYVRNVPDQIRSWVTPEYITLGTDGFGRSDARAQLRQHFEVDRNFIALAALKALADANRIDRKTVVDAIAKLGIDPNKADPLNS
jgi:pyruvate dehydrogenase E1 component